jgi:hypothetical protein
MAPHSSGLKLHIRSEEVSRLASSLRALDKDKARTYIAQAVNRSATELRTEIVRAIRERYNARAKEVRGALQIIKAHASKPYARVFGWGKASIPLYAFSPLPRLPYPDAARPKSGVSVLVTREAGRKTLPGHFIARNKRTGQLMVASRASQNDGRLPIHQRFGPGIFQAIKDHGFEGRLNDFGQRSLEKALAHQLERLLQEVRA